MTTSDTTAHVQQILYMVYCTCNTTLLCYYNIYMQLHYIVDSQLDNVQSKDIIMLYSTKKVIGFSLHL